VVVAAAAADVATVSKVCSGVKQPTTRTSNPASLRIQAIMVAAQGGGSFDFEARTRIA
jgi:hypothetical protein